MVKKLLLWIILFFVWYSISLWFENQWFENYNEINWKINFSCNLECFIVLWDIHDDNLLKISWNLNWKWVVWYWFLDWNQIIPWDFTQINWNNLLEKNFLFNKLSYYNQLKNWVVSVLIIQWELKWENLFITLWKPSFFQNIKNWFIDFLKIEPLTPYSINLRYWVLINWTSIIVFWYLSFLFLFIVLSFIVKDKSNLFLSLALYLVLFISFRNLINYYSITFRWLNEFTFQDENNKTFFDLWDYISFTKKVRDLLELDEKNKKCKLFVKSISEWPFTAHFESVYLKPCKLVSNINDSDYVIFYKYKDESVNWFKEILNYNNSYIFKK